MLFSFLRGFFSQWQMVTGALRPVITRTKPEELMDKLQSKRWKKPVLDSWVINLPESNIPSEKEGTLAWITLHLKRLFKITSV